MLTSQYLVIEIYLSARDCEILLWISFLTFGKQRRAFAERSKQLVWKELGPSVQVERL
jgi:hypothetical protein